MGEFEGNVSIGFASVAKWWKRTEYASLAVMITLATSNPIFKIATALHVGLQTMLLLFYAPIVYYNALSVSYNSDASEKRGLLQKITGFVPNLMYKTSVLLLKGGLYALRRLGYNTNKLDVGALGSLVTYTFIGFRRLLALMIAIYITAEDDESVHAKAFTVFAAFILIQMKFVNGNKASTKPYSKTDFSNVSSWDTFVILFSPSPVKSSHTLTILLQQMRKRLFVISGLLTSLFLYYTFTNSFESFDKDFTWVITIKTLLVLDALFVSTFLADLSSLELNFSGSENSIA